MEEALIAYLLADAGVAAVLAARVHPVKAPQGVLKPYALVAQVSGVREYDTAGAAGLVNSVVQIDCYGTTWLSSKNAARAIVTRLSGYRGTYQSVEFQGCFLIADRALPEDIGTPDELHRVSMDFAVYYKGA